MKTKDEYIKADVFGVPYQWETCDTAVGELSDFSVFGADEKEREELARDLNAFIDMLASSGLLKRDEDKKRPPSTGFDVSYFKIAGLTFAFDGPDFIFEKYFHEFSCGEGAPDQRIRIWRGRPFDRVRGEILIMSDDIAIIDGGECYAYAFPKEEKIYGMRVSKDASAADVYCSPAIEEEHGEAVFHALRHAFLLLAQKNGLFALHSCSILYDGRAWLFSGRSGIGKSTHANLWRDMYSTPILNGDLNIIGFNGGRLDVFGLPWCGTSGIYTTKTYPLGGISFLSQAFENSVSIPKDDEKAVLLLQRMISPSWDAGRLLKNKKFAEEAVKKCGIFKLKCTADGTAAQVMKKAIDNAPTH